MRFRTAVIWSGVSQFGQSGITLLSTIILGRLLTPDDFAIIGLVTVFTALSQMMVDSEMGGALLRKKTVNNADYSTLFYYNLAASIVIYGFLYVGAPYIATYYNLPVLTDVVRVISLTIIIHAFRVVQRIMIFRDLRYKAYAIINVASGVLSLVFAVWLALKGFSYWALVWQQIVLAALNVIFMEVYNQFIPSLTFSIESFKYQFSFGISLLGSDAVKTIANNIAPNIIGKISSLQFTGYYSQMSRLTNFCQSSLGSLMDQTIFPMMAKLEKVTDVKVTYHKLLKAVSLILAVTTFIFIVFAPMIINLVVGKQWLPATWIFRILSLAILPTCIQILCRNVLKTLGLTKRVLYLETVKSAILLSFLIFSTFINTVCVVWSVVIAQTVGAIIWLIATYKDLRIAIEQAHDNIPEYNNGKSNNV